MLSLSTCFGSIHCSLGLPLGLEAPVMTPNGVTFLILSFLFFLHTLYSIASLMHAGIHSPESTRLLQLLVCLLRTSTRQHKKGRKEKKSCTDRRHNRSL